MNTIELSQPAIRHERTALDWRVLAICFLVTLIDGFDTMVLTFVAPLVGREFVLKPEQTGQLFGAGYFGAMLGAMLIGPLADRFGRRQVLMCALAMVALFTWASAHAASSQALMAWRLLAGLGLGAAVPTVIALASESMPASHRSSAVTWMFLGYPLGAVVGGALTAAFLSHGWRAIFEGGALAALLLMPLAWLLLPRAGRPDPASAPAALRPRGSPFASLAAQFGGGRAPAALLLWLGVFCIMVVTYFLVSWIPSVVVRAGFAPAQAALVGVVMSLAGVIGAWALSIVIPRRGPWRLVAGCLLLGALAVWSLGRGLNELAPIMALVAAVGLFVFGGQLNIPALAVELFPRPVLGAGSGWTMGIGRLGSIVGPIIGGQLIGAGFDAPMLFTAAALPTLAAAVCIFLAGRMAPAPVPAP